MSKPAIFYAVVKNFYSIGGFNVMKVTSVDSRLAFGTQINHASQAIRIRIDDIKGRFDTQEQAEKALNGIKIICDAARTLTDDLKNRIKGINDSRNKSIDALVKRLTNTTD